MGKMMNSFSGKTICIAISFLLWGVTGCTTVGPDYTPPDVSSPKSWYSPLSGDLSSDGEGPGALAEWWQNFDDPLLSQLIERALKNNFDIKMATAKLREARAERRITRAERFPTVEASGGYTKSRSNDASGNGTTRDSYSLDFDAGWEIDIFGGIRRSIEAADAEYDSITENYRDVMVSMIAEIALNYIELRIYQKQMILAENNIRIQSETLELTHHRFESGLTTALDVERATYNLEDSRSQLPVIRTNLDAAKHRIAVLLGQNPGTLHDELADFKPIPTAAETIAIGAPVDILRRRPDIRKAERELAAQSARIGVATAELYPKFTLMGTIGLESISSADLLSADSLVSSYGPRFSWKIFNAGAVRRNIEVQNALQEQALINYEFVITAAFEEIENTLVAYAEEQHRQQSLIKAEKAAQQAVVLALQEYNSGLSDFQSVLDTQRVLFSYQGQLAESQGNLTIDLIRLYKALGGGWATENASRS